MQVTIDGVHYAPISNATSRIGLAISTYNRADVLKRAVEQHLKHLPTGALVVIIDDGSNPAAVVPDGVQVLRHETSLGIVASKNASLSVLVDAGCEHLFLWDDVAWPIADNCHLPYIESPEPHLAYQFKDLAWPKRLNDMAELYRDDKHVAYSGANTGHRRALEWASWQDCRVVILEDDALPVAGFTEMVGEWLNRFPDSLVSFYLGTGRPPQYQMQVAEKLIVADKSRADFITLSRLIHGVCYSVPPQNIHSVLSRWDSSKPADYAVGDAYGGAVIYPCWSLVDHADGEPVERHPDTAPRTERRRAWRLA